MATRFTAEERNLDKEDILNMLKEGLSQHAIARELGRSVQYINNLKQELVKDGLITDEEIAQYKIIALDNKVLELINSQADILTISKTCGVSKESIRASIKRLISENRIADGMAGIKSSREGRNKNKEQQKALVLERLLQGNINAKQIQEELGIGESALYRYVKELIEEKKIDREVWENRNNETSETNPEKERQVLELLYSGKYTKFEIASMVGVYVKYVTWVSENLLDKSKITRKEKAKPIESEDVQEEILKNLKKGLTYKYIARILGLEPNQVTETIRLLKKQKKITEEEIRSARNKKIEKDRKEILIYLKRGYNCQEIFAEMEGVYEKNYINKQVKILMDNGLITPEQYEKYKREAPQGIIDISRTILEQLREGKSYSEMIEDDKSGYLSLRRIKDAKKLLVTSGQITDDEIELYRKTRLKGQRRFIDSIVLQGLKQGKTVKEIMDSNKHKLLTEGRVRDSKQRLIDEGKITEAEIEDYIKQAEETKQRKLDKFVLRQLKLGKSEEEIFNEYSKQPISQKDVFRSRQRLLDSGRITIDEIYRGIRERKLQEFKIRKSKSTFPGDFDAELVAMLKHGFSIEEIAKYFKLSLSRMYRYVTPTIKNYGITYNDIKNYKIQAKADYEELKELARDDNHKIAQNDFFKMAKFYADHGQPISAEDLKILQNIILINSRLLSTENLKFIIMQHIGNNNLALATRFINECLSVYGKTQYAESLREFKTHINRELLKKQARDLAQRGLSTSQIASDLKIFEIDVINMLKSSNGYETPGGRD